MLVFALHALRRAGNASKIASSDWLVVGPLELVPVGCVVFGDPGDPPEPAFYSNAAQEIRRRLNVDVLPI